VRAAGEWYLAGSEPGAGTPLLLHPERGAHSLALVGPEGAVLDRVAFEVR
jgi:hypothetical protein